MSVDSDNKKTSKKEVALFIKKKPKKYLAYLSLDGREVQTWVGDKLGYVLQTNETRLSSKFGNKKYSVTVKGINGVIYRGIGAKGEYIILKQIK